MADGLANVLAGFDPTMGLQEQTALAAQSAAPSSYATSPSDPASSMFANISGGFGQSRAVNLAQQLAQQRSAAIPDVAAALASDDPWKYVAANPDMNPIAAAHIVASTPEQVATSRQAMADALYRKAAAGLTAAQTPGAAAVSAAKVARAGEAGIGGGGGAAPAGTPGPVQQAPFQFPGRPPGGVAAVAPVAPVQPEAPPDPLAGMPSNPAQREGWFKGLQPAQRFAVTSYSKMLAARQAAMKQTQAPAGQVPG